MSTPNEYGDTVLNLAACTCHPRRVVQELDDKGNFVIEHYHAPECAKTITAKLWQIRSSGIAPGDHRSTFERFQQRQAFLDGHPKRSSDIPTRVLAPREPYRDGE